MKKQKAYQEAEKLANQPPFESQVIYKMDGEYGVAPSSASDGVNAVAEFVDEITADYRNARAGS